MSIGAMYRSEVRNLESQLEAARAAIAMLEAGFKRENTARLNAEDQRNVAIAALEEVKRTDSRFALAIVTEALAKLKGTT